MVYRVHGKVKFLDIEGGFWGIESDNKKYLVLDMPEQLKCHGMTVDCTLRSAEDIVSIFAWGTPVYIHGFKTSAFPK